MSLITLIAVISILGGPHAQAEEPTVAQIRASKIWQSCIDESRNGYFDGQTVGYYDIYTGLATKPLPEECKPDTLYSWGNANKTELFQANAGNRKSWDKNFGRPIFFSISPIASFAYGSTAIRIKLRKSVRFEINRQMFNGEQTYCEDLESEGHLFDTIIVRPWRGAYTAGTDYIVCSPQVLESWSENSPKALDETLKALDWVQSQPQETWITYVLVAGKQAQFNPQFMLNKTVLSSLDGMDWSIEHLMQNIEILKRNSKKWAGFWNPHIDGASDKMFKTRHLSYWNTESED